MKFVTLFPETQNVHLVKDVGMIAYILTKYYGYQGTLVCYNNSEKYTYLHKEVKGLKLDFLKKYTGNDIIDGLCYLLTNARNIDVLHVFHVSARRNYAWILLYKLLNPQGKIYLKLDADVHIKDINFHKKNMKSRIKKWILEKCSLISVESVGLQQYLISHWRNDIQYIPNGYYNFGKKELVSYKDKENIICTVGRLGTRQKNTELLVDALANIVEEKLQDWKVYFVGECQEKFLKYIETKYVKKPYLKKIFVFKGNILNREELYNIYSKSKIFCLPSRWESFCLVIPEAMYFKNYVITTDFSAAYDLTDNNRVGRMISNEDVVELQNAIEECLDGKVKMEYLGELAYRHIEDNFNWIDIGYKLSVLLKNVNLRDNC